MGNLYDSQTISGYNATPPADDGSQVAANQVSWSKHKDKLGDPLKNLAEGINTEVDTTFGQLPFYAVNAQSTNYTIIAGDDHKIISCTNSITITLLAAATAGTAFRLMIYNAGTGEITIDGNGSETINGSLTQTLLNQYDSVELWCDGTNWLILTDAISEPNFNQGYLFGLGLSNNSTDSDHDIDIAAGECRGADDDENIVLSAIIKQIDASWAAGTNQGGLSSSLTLSADTWYHVHAIVVSASADVGFDTSVTAANLVTDHSATAYRRIGSVLTDGSSNIIAFAQTGDRFDWGSPVQDFSGAGVASAVTQALTVPPDVSVEAILSGTQVGTNVGQKISYLSALDQNDDAASTTNLTVQGGDASGARNVSYSGVRIRTDTSQQIRKRDNTTTLSLRIVTNGWMDRRGKD